MCFLASHPLAAARTIAIKSAPRQALNRNDLLAFQHLNRDVACSG
jgi:hypothetical protein